MSEAPHSCEIVVIGGGIAGAFVADALERQGYDVAWLAPASHSGGGTQASGAMLGVLGEVTPDDSPEALALRREAASAWSEPLDELDVPQGTGTFVVASARRPADVAAVRAMAAAAQVGEAERVEPEDAPGLAPATDHWPAAVLHLPRERWTDPSAVVERLRVRLRRRAISQAVHTIKHRGGRVEGVRLADGAVLASREVVLCTGADLALLGASGLDPGLVPRILTAKGVGALLDAGPGSAPAHVMRTPNREFACGLHVVPRAGGRVYVGATNRATRLPDSVGRATAGELQQVLAGVIAELYGRADGWQVDRILWGRRALSADGRPSIGRTAVEGLSVVTGAYRNGVLLAPLIARRIVDELDGGPADPELTPQRPVRDAGALEIVFQHAPDLAALLAEPAWAPRVPHVLRAFATMALGENDRADALRSAMERLFARYGRGEILPEAVVEAIEYLDGPH